MGVGIHVPRYWIVLPVCVYSCFQPANLYTHDLIWTEITSGLIDGSQPAIRIGLRDREAPPVLRKLGAHTLSLLAACAAPGGQLRGRRWLVRGVLVPTIRAPCVQ